MELFLTIKQAIMKQNTSVIADKFSKNVAIMLALASLVYAIPVTAQQRNFRDRDRSWQGDDSRRQISRPPSIHQRQLSTFSNPDNTRRIENRNDQRALADNFNRRSFDRSSSISTNREYSRQNIDQNVVRRNYPNDLNRGGISYSKPGGIYNRPGFGQNHIDRSYDYRGYNKSYNSYRSPSYNAYNPNWRYAYAPRRYSVFNTLPSFYQMHFMPYLAMYNKKGNLLATFEGAMKMEDLIRTFK